MKKNPNTKNEERDARIYKMYKKGAYTYRGLANLFRLSHPRVIAIVKKYEQRENKDNSSNCKNNRFFVGKPE